MTSFAFNTEVWPGTIKVLEETSELGIELAKLMMVDGVPEQYWGDRPLRDNIVDEAADVIASLTYFTRKNFTADERKRMMIRVGQKLLQYHQWESEP